MDFFERFENIAKAIYPHGLHLSRRDPELSGLPKWQIETEARTVGDHSPRGYGETPEEALAKFCLSARTQLKQNEPLAEACRWMEGDPKDAPTS